MREVDVRWLPPPEPFEHIIRALYQLSPLETMRVLIHREPFPLYDVLRDDGNTWQTTLQPDGCYEILITRCSN
jgi:uncharacterized protein (DUF2249 family)